MTNESDMTAEEVIEGLQCLSETVSERSPHKMHARVVAAISLIQRQAAELAGLRAGALPPQSHKAESGKAERFCSCAWAAGVCADFSPDEIECCVNCSHREACHAPADKQAGEQEKL